MLVTNADMIPMGGRSTKCRNLQPSEETSWYLSTVLNSGCCLGNNV